jgi:hypothetical protein
MDFHQFWIGKDINLDELWQHYDNGTGYITKYHDSKFYLLRLSFDNFPPDLPLFNFEIVSKTIKSVFQDVKYECLSEWEYEREAPLYFYQVDRGSGIWELLATQSPLLLFVIALSTGGYKAIQGSLDHQKASLEIFDK